VLNGYTSQRAILIHIESALAFQKHPQQLSHSEAPGALRPGVDLQPHAIYFRIPFSRFTAPSIWLALCDVDVVGAVPHLLLGVTVILLCIAPFWFNPHQFTFLDFVIDYWYVPFFLYFQSGFHLDS